VSEPITPIQKVKLAEKFLKMACECGVRYHTDGGDEEAVAVFKNLLATLDRCHLSDLQTWADLNVHHDPVHQTKIMNEMIASVGTSYWPADAMAFVRDFNAKSVH
jgi:hypothetical protein